MTRTAGPALPVVSPTSQAPPGLSDALLRLDLRLRLHVDTFREQLTERARDPFRGLCISEPEVDLLLEQTPPAEAARYLLAEPSATFAPRLTRLAQLFNLTPFEQEALLVCLAPELDLRYERLYAYLQDDISRKRPTLDLILRLLQPISGELAFVRECLGPNGSLAARGLLVTADDPSLPILARPLQLDARIVEYLVGSDTVDPRLASYVVLSPAVGLAEVSDVDADLACLLRESASTDAFGPLVYVHGAFGADKINAVGNACRSVGLPLLLVDIRAVLRAATPERIVACAAREALLQGAVLGIDGFDDLLRDSSDAFAILNVLRSELSRRRGPSVLLGERRWEPATWCPDAPSVTMELDVAEVAARERLWHRHLNGQLPRAEAARLAERYRLDDAGVRAVAAAARGRSLLGGRHEIGAEDVSGAARAIASPPLDGLAVRIEPRYEWSDIVLAPDATQQLQELCARARHQSLVLATWGYGRKLARRSGLTALLAGVPGTGKTMSAEIIARDLGLDLYRIDLSVVVSKYIGETEKNLERIFRAADQGDAVLLFDEADALFGKRSEVRDAHDRYANVEVAYLLQRLEMYAGIAILTTNLRGNIDEAFLRRLDCVLEFPLPEEPERLLIWRRSLPAEAPLGKDVDLAFLARKFKLAGGHIRNITLTAAYLAAADGGPIGMKHLARGTRREYQKLGKLAVVNDFEQYFDLLEDAEERNKEGVSRVK